MSKADKAQIDLLLPHKERFTQQNAGAVSTVVFELARHLDDTQTQKITIFGTAVETPKAEVNFIGLQPRPFFWQSRNDAMAKAYLRYLQSTGHRPDFIEVHGRPQVALTIAKARPDVPVALYLHNDARQTKGAKSVAERLRLANNLAAVISVSEYIKSCFTDGLPDEAHYKAKHFVNYLGVNLRPLPAKKRKKQLFLAGRMVPEKGFLEACLGAVPVLQEHRDWQICLAGGKRFQEDSLSPYEKQLQRALAPLGDQAVILGHQPVSEVRRYQQESEICIVPSLWQEPGGLSVVECLAAGTALITTKRGGLPEVADGRAILLDKTSPQDFEEVIRRLITSQDERAFLQSAARKDFPYSATNMSHRLAQFRDSLI